MRSLIGMSLLLALVGCQMGPDIDTFDPARRAGGAEVSVSLEVDGQRLSRSGELIAVRDDDLLVLTSEGLARIGNEVMRGATFSDASPGQFRGEGSDRERQRVARFSRYPFGLTSEQLSSLLEALGQSELIEVGG